MSVGTDDRPLFGIALKLASVAVLLAMASLVKTARETMPPGEVVFFRSLFAIPPILAWLWWRGELADGLRVRAPRLHLWRGLMGGTAMGLIFTALGLIPLPEVTAIGFAAPVLVTVFAALFLGERLRIWRISAVAVGLVGVMVMLAPRLSAAGGASTPDETSGALAMLGATVLMAGAICMVRRLVATDESAAIVFWFSVICTGLSLVTLPFGWAVPSGAVLGAMVLAGLAGGIGQILLTEAYRHADAGVISPFEYASLVMALAVGWAVFGETARPAVLAGAALVIAAGLVIAWRESRTRAAVGAPRPAGGAG
ncbi:MAG: DMT family transporter [Paracoccaceae bacterium]